MGRRPGVLIVATSPATRRALCAGLELGGLTVVEASSPRQARGLLADEGDLLAGAVIDPAMPGGMELARELVGSDLVGLTFVLHTGALSLCEELTPIAPEELPTLARRLAEHGASSEGDVDLAGVADAVTAAASVLRRELDEVVADWRELCQWDPMLPPEALPGIAPAVVAAVVDALARPQPLGWGPDPEVEKVAVVFGTAAPSLDVAVGQLICLREAMRRRLAGRLTPRTLTESSDRLTMLVDRAIGCCVAVASARLERAAHVDLLTDLANRRGLERDLRRLIGAMGRTGEQAGLLLIEAVDLRHVNEREGHASGDELLRALATTVLDSVGYGDTVYRSSGDELVVLGPGGEEWAKGIVARASAPGAPRMAWGAADVPADGTEVAPLLDAASRRLVRPARC